MNDIGVIAKFAAVKVLPFHVVAVGHFDKLTSVAPAGDPTRLPPSADNSYKSAYNSYRGTPLGARHVIDIRNCVSGPVVDA